MHMYVHIVCASRHPPTHKPFVLNSGIIINVLKWSSFLTHVRCCGTISAIRRLFRSFFDHSWRLLGPLDVLGCPMWVLGIPLESLGFFGGPWAFLGEPWGCLGTSSGVLGCPWERPGTSLGSLGGALVAIGNLLALRVSSRVHWGSLGSL